MKSQKLQSSIWLTALVLLGGSVQASSRWRCCEATTPIAFQAGLPPVASREAIEPSARVSSFEIEAATGRIHEPKSRSTVLVELILGSSAPETLLGSEGDDRMFAYNGIDSIYAYLGDDEIHAGLGADFVDGLDGDDLIFGEGGGDWLLGNDGNDVIYGGRGADLIYGGAGNDDLYGGPANDYLEGESGGDVLYGGIGIDSLIGGDGNDELYGEAGRDFIDGGSGSDLIVGGPGGDVMTGGPGADRFVFHPGDFGLTTRFGADQITDFSWREDVIDLSAIDAIEGGEDDYFEYIGSRAFSQRAGELSRRFANHSYYLVGDTNGDGVADFMIVVRGGWFPSTSIIR